ncbi:transmembrane protein [Anaeramoeba flamelloides]|uniref:Transmembrane protein n=1 Tax=Anaeramoeba flamelloides TaxID=1746091 RepID=A0ABQ8XHH6_9EUKA|nr:transmembrane protein [Anaeramoeba flamelloides]
MSNSEEELLKKPIEKRDLMLRFETFSKSDHRCFFLLFLFLLIIGGISIVQVPSALHLQEFKYSTTSKGKIQIHGLFDKYSFLSQGLLVDIILVNAENSQIKKKVLINISLSGYDDSQKKWIKIIDSEQHQREINCRSKANCTRTVLAYEPVITSQNYSIDATISSLNNQNFFDGFIYTKLFAYYYYFFITTPNNNNNNFNNNHNHNYNNGNPFLPLSVFVRHWANIFIDLICIIPQFYGLGFIWFCILDSYRTQNGEQRTFKKFYLPKIIFFSIFAIITFVVCFWSVIHEKNSGAESAIDTVGAWLFFVVLFFICFVIFIIWLAFIIYNGFINIEIPRLKRKLKFMFIFMIITFAFLFITLIIGVTQSLNGIKLIFFTIFYTFNVSSLWLVFAILPSEKVLSKIDEGTPFSQKKGKIFEPYYTNNENSKPIIEEIFEYDDEKEKN